MVGRDAVRRDCSDAETITIRHLDAGHEFSFRGLDDLLGQRRSTLPVRGPALKHAAKSHPGLYETLLSKWNSTERNHDTALAPSSKRKSRTAMPQYFFSLHDDTDLPDPDGLELPAIDDACREAIRRSVALLAGSVQRDVPETDWRLEVTDERGSVIYWIEANLGRSPIQ